MAFFQVTGRDEDLGLFGADGFAYQMLPPAGGTNDKLQIDVDTGQVSVKELLNTNNPDIVVVVRIADNNGAGQSTDANLTVIVVNANNNAPVFDPSAYAPTVSEGAAAGSLVETVAATDADTGANNDKVTFTIVSGNSGGSFSLDPDTGDIKIAAPLDRESVSEYILVVKAADGGLPPLSSTANVVITVSDINEDFPIFTQATPSVDLPEAAPVGSFVAQFSATDADSAYNGQALSYALIGNTNDDFAIDNSGKVTVAKALDSDVTNVYNILVKADDNGTPSKSNTTALVITVIANTNIYAPQFSLPFYRKYARIHCMCGATKSHAPLAFASAHPLVTPLPAMCRV